MSKKNPCTVERVERSVIENKLLVALNDDSGKVACLFITKQDLEDMIEALEGLQIDREFRDERAYRTRCDSLAAGMEQLLKEAFPE